MKNLIIIWRKKKKKKENSAQRHFKPESLMSVYTFIYFFMCLYTHRHIYQVKICNILFFGIYTCDEMPWFPWTTCEIPSFVVIVLVTLFFFSCHTREVKKFQFNEQRGRKYSILCVYAYTFSCLHFARLHRSLFFSSIPFHKNT